MTGSDPSLRVRRCCGRARVLAPAEAGDGSGAPAGVDDQQRSIERGAL
jgi:hypothetical protein